MSENKTSRYFKYAIGEIILVVIGILIALQVNNWNEQRNANLQSKAYLKNLSIEINQNLKLMQRDCKSIAYLAEISNGYHSKLFNPNVEVHDSVISNFILKINPIYKFNPSKTVLQDYLNSGYLKEIKDTKLKNNILYLESRYQYHLENITTINDQYNNYIQPYLMAHGDYSKIIDSIGQYKIMKTAFNHNKDYFINNKTLSNNLIWYTSYLVDVGQNGLESNNKGIQRLSDRINTYLDD